MKNENETMNIKEDICISVTGICPSDEPVPDVTIEAKRELEEFEERKGCSYCKNIAENTTVKVNSVESVSIYCQDDPTMDVRADDPFCGNSVRINFCPCCGRKLRENLLKYLPTSD